MKLALVYPPYVSEATSPSLGVNLLKAYLQKELSGLKIKVFDLNIDYYHRCLGKLGEYDLYPKKISDEVKDKIKEAAALFRPPEKDEFYNSKAYNIRGSLFIDFFQKVFRKDFEQMKQDNWGPDDEIRKIFSKVLDFSPDMVGFSMMYTPQSPYTLAMAQIAQENDIPVAVGGAKATFYPELFTKYLGNRFSYILMGEGEAGARKLIECAENGKEPTEVPDLLWSLDGKQKYNDRHETIDINEIPAPDFSDAELDKYFSPLPILPVLTSKGCYWQRCQFCNHHKTYMDYRAKTTEKAIEEVRSLSKKHNVKHFYFCDEMIPAKRLSEISNGIKDLSINYLALVKPLEEFNEKNLQMIAQGGCRMLLWGVEAGSQKVLDRMQKGTSIPTVEKVLSFSRASGINNFLYVMTGFPTETKEESAETLSFLERNKQNVDYLIASPFALEQNAPIFAKQQEFGITNVEKKMLNEFQYVYTFERTKGMTDDEVKAIDARGFYRFNKYPMAFTRLRDHLLLYASKR